MYNKVCIIGPFPPFMGGIPQYNELLAREFAKKSNVLLLSYKRQYPKFLVKNREQIDKKYLPKDEFLDKVKFIIDSINPLSWFSVLRKINKYNPDIVILPWWVIYWSPMYIFFLLYFKFKKIETLLICHNVYEHENNILKRFFAKLVFKLADRFLVHSNSEKYILSKIVGIKLISKHLIPLFDFDKKKKIKKNKPNKYKTLKLLFFGSIRKYKGLDLLLESLKILNDSKIKLTIVGDFWKGTKVYEDYINKNKIRNVEITNSYIPDDEISSHFTNCDVVVLPYKSATGSAVIPLSYHYEKPVLVTNVGGLPDAVKHKLTGFVVESNADELAMGIEWFIKNKEQNFTSEINRMIIEDMSWSGLVKEIRKPT